MENRKLLGLVLLQNIRVERIFSKVQVPFCRSKEAIQVLSGNQIEREKRKGRHRHLLHQQKQRKIGNEILNLSPEQLRIEIFRMFSERNVSPEIQLGVCQRHHSQRARRQQRNVLAERQSGDRVQLHHLSVNAGLLQDKTDPERSGHLSAVHGEALSESGFLGFANSLRRPDLSLSQEHIGQQV